MVLNHWMYFVKNACRNYIRNMNEIEFLNELHCNISNYLKPRQYDWNKIKNDKNVRDIFEKLVIKINLSDNCYVSDKEIRDIRQELLSIIENNSYKRSIIKSKKKFLVESSFNYISGAISQEINDKYMEDGIFIFGGNQRYREVRSILNEIISQIENENNDQNEVVIPSERVESVDNSNNSYFSIGIHTNRNLSRRDRLERRRRRRRINRSVNRNNVLSSTDNNFIDNESENNTSESEIIDDTIHYENDDTNFQENYDFNDELNGLITSLEIEINE